MVCHPIEPVYDEHSRILILGSFPSVKSREAMFFYGHPQNRFWKVLAAVFGRPVPVTVEAKRRLLLHKKSPFYYLRISANASSISLCIISPNS